MEEATLPGVVEQLASMYWTVALFEASGGSNSVASCARQTTSSGHVVQKVEASCDALHLATPALPSKAAATQMVLRLSEIPCTHIRHFRRSPRSYATALAAGLTLS